MSGEQEFTEAFTLQWMSMVRIQLRISPKSQPLVTAVYHRVL
jgi:hypothetical protein